MEQTPQRRITAGQVRLLEAKRAEVWALRRAGAEPDDDLANDLAGIRFVLRAALFSQELTEAERDELERHEREARDLLRRTVTRTGGADGGIHRGGLAGAVEQRPAAPFPSLPRPEAAASGLDRLRS